MGLGLRVCLARIMKRSKLTYCIKTKRELSKHESLKVHLRKSRCLVKDSLHGGSFKISNPSVGHPIAYEKFVMDKHTKVENTLKRYLSVDFSISKSLIFRKINP